MKKIGVITGTRAEYGLLKPLMERIRSDEELELCIIATGMHLSPEFGLTYREIEGDGFEINERVEMLLSSDSPVGICKSIGLGIISLSEVFARNHIDMAVILGDRYEALAAAISAMTLRIPIAHLHGGELTEGAVDESIRHSVTKMSYLHFTSTEEYRSRVIQLGENPDRVFCVGALGVENIKNVPVLSKVQLEESIGFKFEKKTAIVTYHPVTLENDTAEEQFLNLLKALDEICSLNIIFTKANADADGRIVNELIDMYVAKNPDKACAFTSLGQKRYLSALSYCDIVIGNSSSGVIEAPSFHKPTVNIGDRQKGRIRAKSVIDCGYGQEEIKKAIEYGLSPEFQEVCKKSSNPYEKENTSYEIIKIMKEHLADGKINLKKTFYDLQAPVEK